MRFLIVDGYPAKSRDEFTEVGMRLAWELYRDLLIKHVPDAEYDVWLASDAPREAPGEREVRNYTGILWTGCNLTVYHTDDQRVTSQLGLAERCYKAGVPSIGSCWGLQVAVVAAGGKVGPHPEGREMGVARKIRLTEAGRTHPMMTGKPDVYSHLVSHDDEVQELPKSATLLAGNDWSRVQAAAVTHENGAFWGTQYHPEYDLHEVARLILARETKLINQGLFRRHDDLVAYSERLEELFANPDRKDLRWQLAIDDDILSDTCRQCEFANWVRTFVSG